MAAPVPFEITESGTSRIATNGDTTLTLLDADGRVFRRRAIKGMSMKPCAEAAIPCLNQLAGELLASPDMPAHAVVQRLADISAQIQPVPSQPVEWAVAELDGVRVYMMGRDVIVTRQELTP